MVKARFKLREEQLFRKTQTNSTSFQRSLRRGNKALLAIFLLIVLNLTSACCDNIFDQHCITNYSSFSSVICIYVENMCNFLADNVIAHWNLKIDIPFALQYTSDGMFQMGIFHSDRYLIFFILDIAVYIGLTKFSRTKCFLMITYQNRQVLRGIRCDRLTVKDIHKQIELIKPNGVPAEYFMRTPALPVLFGNMTLEYLADKEHSRCITVEIQDSV